MENKVGTIEQRMSNFEATMEQIRQIDTIEQRMSNFVATMEQIRQMVEQQSRP